ncbi:hypothetical protein D3C86_2162520 [compost metagenome]
MIPMFVLAVPAVCKRLAVSSRVKVAAGFILTWFVMVIVLSALITTLPLFTCKRQPERSPVEL